MLHTQPRYRRFCWAILLTFCLISEVAISDPGATVQAQAAPATPTATASPTATPTPWIVTATPTAQDVWAAATLAAQQTANALSTGTATPTPRNMVLATRTPTPQVVTSTPTAENSATATLMALRETAVALTTGTPWQVTATPTNSPTATSTPLIVTATPTPVDVLAAATRAVRLTAEALTTGTPTPLARNVLIATKTPTPMVVTSTPTAENNATAVAMALRETAIAFTTGVPPMVTATPTPRSASGSSGPTATPLAIALGDLTATPTPAATAPFPPSLVGKILFLADLDGRKGAEAYVMNPDGSEIAKLTSMEFYNRANARESYAADRRFRAFVRREQGGKQLLQIHYADAEFGTEHLLTRFGAGTAWDPAWSPTGDAVAFVSNESRTDEIWLVRKGEWPAIKLTQNDWAWDHHPTWSPDGSQILFSSNRNGRQQLWVMEPDGSKQRVLVELPFEAWHPVWVKGADQ